MSSHLLGEVVSSHIALLVSYPFIRKLTQVDPGDADARYADRAVPIGSPWVNSHARRLLDIGVAAVALLILSPVMLVCWVLVRFSSRGPVFFRQWRAGRDGSEFELYKFRSMRVQTFSTQAGHTVFGDSRITAAGGFLRRYKMDELPQFWNVLKGDMSLVGPRPKLAHHEALLMPYRPGLTGEATLAFRHEERMLAHVPEDQVDQFYECVVKPIKASLDVDYMENATFSSDLRLLWRTFSRCVNCSSDARRELATLVQEYAPEHSGLISHQAHDEVSDPSYHAPHFLPEFTDDLMGDLDDAA